MKSPLVEALRQASGTEPSSEHAETEVEPAETHVEHSDADEASEPQVEHQAPDSGELQLMETSATLPIDGAGILPIDGGGILPIDGAGILPIDGAFDAEDEEGDAEFYETSSLQVANDANSTDSANDDVKAVPFVPVANSRRRSSIARLGLYTPLICIFLSALAAGAYSFYQSLGASSRNSHHTAISSRGGSTAEQGAATTTAVETAQNRFQLLTNEERDQP